MTRGRCWLTKACDSGFLLSCRNLAVLYASGRGVARDPVQALALYQRSCDNNNLMACNEAGMLLQTARDLPRDDARMAEWTCSRSRATAVSCWAAATLAGSTNWAAA